MIYIHIPYCRSHCTYCGFYSELLPRAGSASSGCDEASSRKAVPSSFVDALCAEIRSEASCAQMQAPSPPTLYIGGGTPSLLDEKSLLRILEALEALPAWYRNDDGGYDEFTVEVNPDDITPSYAAALLRCGVSRVSMGVQSFDDALLHLMGRRHSGAGALNAYRILREALFDNISIDLIFGVSADFSIDAVRDGLLRMAASEGHCGATCGLPQHISCYQLGVEEGSGLEKMISKGLWAMPSDEECARQYGLVCDLLRSLGYEHYEISNWALPLRRSIHNSGYWTHAPYIGFGPGAHSLLSDGRRLVRRWNNPSLSGYLSAFAADPALPAGELFSIAAPQNIRGGETLSPEEIREEEIMLGLRTLRGCPEHGIPPIAEKDWFVSDSIIASLL